MGSVKYPKEMREQAKLEGKHLVTISLPGLTFQGAVTDDSEKELDDFVCAWIKRRFEKADSTKRVEDGN
jgi:hypothetical protein